MVISVHLAWSRQPSKESANCRTFKLFLAGNSYCYTTPILAMVWCMKVALRFVARRVTPDNTCSAIYDVSMVLLQLQTSAAWTEVVTLPWWHSGTVLTSLDLLLILDISRGATPIVVLCGNLSIDQLKFCVSCLRCYWYRAHRYLWRSCPVWHAITAHQLRCNVSPVTVHLSCWVERLKAPSNSKQRWLMWTRGRAETPSCGVRQRIIIRTLD